MQLPGRLSASTLGDLLGALYRERVSGILDLRESPKPGVAGRVHRIHLRAGLIAAIDTALPVPPVGEILRRRGFAVAERYLLDRIEAGDRRTAGEILTASGVASPAVVRAALTEQLRARIEALFGLEDATVAFYTARPLRHVVKVSPLGPGEFLHGRPRARDRLHRHPAAAPRRAAPPAESPQDRALGLLGLPQGAGVGDIRRSFRRLATLLHPDRLAATTADEQQRNAARFAELSAAYHLLLT